MLYPEKNHPLTPQKFQNPGKEYRATPFWAWNNKLDANDLTWQIEQFKKMGFGGFHMHVRTGLATEYLSDEYMDIVGTCVEKAREEDMLAWLYDEDRWPSGAAGGLVTKNEDYRIRHLLLTRHPYGTPGMMSAPEFSDSSDARSENGTLLACFDIQLDKNGDLQQYQIIKDPKTAQGFALYAYLETATPDPWYNNQTYVNTLDPVAIQEFIQITYERYNQFFNKEFGNVIPAIFTDEPQFSRKGTLDFADDTKDITLPWTDDLTLTFAEAYNGEDLLAHLPELLWNLPDNQVSVVRYHYHDHIAERFARAFADQCGSWCKEHNIMLTGHMMEEPSLKTQTHALGEAMRSYRSFGLPGIDMLCDRREFTTAKQAQSAARQYGAPGVLSELYGVTNWDFDFRGHKLQGDWQAALGVTVRVPHLSWVSMNGEAKRDYPSTFNYQSPWYEEYPLLEDHYARVASAMTRGKAVCKVGVIHPIESYWLHWGVKQNTAAIRQQKEEEFENLCSWLLGGLVDFDYISESLFPQQCDIQSISDGKLPVGEMAYDTILVPNLETIRQSTLDRLEEFKKNGGRLIFLGDAPVYVDALPNKAPAALFAQCEQLPFRQLAILNALENEKQLEIRDKTGTEVSNLLYQLRQDEEGLWLFIAHGDEDTNRDIPQKQDLHIKVNGIWAATLYNTTNGSISQIPVEHLHGDTVFKRDFYDHDSLLIKLDNTPPLYLQKTHTIAAKDEFLHDGFSFSPLPPQVIQYLDAVPVTLHEPNVLLLDIAEYSLDDGDWMPREEVLRLDNALRHQLGWPYRGNSIAQPWVEKNNDTPNQLKLRYTFQSQIEITDAKLALENALSTTVSLNGTLAGPPAGWYVDKSFQTVGLPPISVGENVLELTIPYGPSVNVEAIYLLGDFGVMVQGIHSTLTSPITHLCFGDITRQGLPFYGGNLTYHLAINCVQPEPQLTIAATAYRGHMLRVSMDGTDQGPIVYSPYELIVRDIAQGLHNIDITYYGSRINTFGQLHCQNRAHGFWWGPNSWRSIGASWSYEYQFWPQGILKSPEISW